MLPNRNSFRARVRALIDSTPEGAWQGLSIDLDSWLGSLIRHRNMVAHATEQRAAHREFVEGVGMRALRDISTAIVITLLIHNLGVQTPAAQFAADRLGYRYTRRYTLGQLGFTSTGITVA